MKVCFEVGVVVVEVDTCSIKRRTGQLMPENHTEVSNRGISSGIIKCRWGIRM